jgi:hypothetical protein
LRWARKKPLKRGREKGGRGASYHIALGNLQEHPLQPLMFKVLVGEEHRRRVLILEIIHYLIHLTAKFLNKKLPGDRKQITVP